MRLKIFSDFQECGQVFYHPVSAVGGFKHKGAKFPNPVFTSVKSLNKLVIKFLQPFF